MMLTFLEKYYKSLRILSLSHTTTNIQLEVQMIQSIFKSFQMSHLSTKMENLAQSKQRIYSKHNLILCTTILHTVHKVQVNKCLQTSLLLIFTIKSYTKDTNLTLVKVNSSKIQLESNQLKLCWSMLKARYHWMLQTYLQLEKKKMLKRKLLMYLIATSWKQKILSGTIVLIITDSS